MFGYLRNQDFNICLLQDVHCRNIGVPYFRNAWGTDVIVAPYTNNARGVAILTKNIDVSFSDTCIDDCGNFIITKARVHDTADFCLVNVYGPNSDDPNFYKKLSKDIDKSLGEETMPIIIAGDFNLTLNQSMDNFNYIRENNTSAKEAVKNIMSDKGLIDIYRDRNPVSRRYTWRAGSRIVKQARLDMFLISASLEGYVENAGIQPGYRSDHSIVTLKLDITKQTRGRGLFKFNASLLKDPDYVKLVKNTMKETVCEYAIPIYREEYVNGNPARVELTISSSLFFEVLMLTLRRETVSFGIRKKKMEKEQEIQLESAISQMGKKLDEIGTQEISDQLHRMKNEFEEIREKRLRGSLVRSRAIWRENAEKPSKYFLTLEKRRYESKMIPCIRTSEGVKKRQCDILKTFEEFFCNRFCQQNSPDAEEDSGDYLSDLDLNRIATSDRVRLEEQVTIGELESTLFSMKNGTSPGSDGFSVEFYKFFWTDIREFFYAMCIESLSRGTLPQTLKEGIIVLLPKPNKPRDLLKSYRPITLLNVCYKIISGTIANRLKAALQTIIDPCQSAYLKGRFMGDNIRMIYDIMQLMKEKDINGVLLSLDIEAAFDSVSWSFIEEALKIRDFPPNIIRWFNTLYHGSFARILYNGHLSGKINLARSCRQGDALSCYLFILVMDVLARKIQRNVEIKGIRMANKEHKVSMYADDTVCLIEPNERCIMELFQELGWFAKFSGLRPNLEKTQAMWIGASCREAAVFQGNVALQWRDKLKILGITFENNLKNITNVYTEKVNEIKREIGKWMFRNVSLQGKVTIIKSLLISKVSHLFATIPNPSPAIVNELNSVLFKFLWHGKREKIKRMSLIKSPQNGGLGMVDLQSYISAFKIGWIRRYITKQGVWKSMVNEITGKNIEFWQLGQTALRKKVPHIKNQFWREVLSALADFRDVYMLDEHQLSASAIFFSDVTKFKCTWIKEWHERGVRTLNDLLKFDGTLLTHEEMKQMYNVQGTFLDFNALINSLPVEWRKTNGKRKLIEPIMDPVISYIISKDTGISHLSKVLLEGKSKHIANIWEGAWESRQIETNWENTYSRLKDTPVQYRNTRYKVITRIVGTNSLLKKMKIRDTDACGYCMVRENIEHKFWYCRKVQTFWNSLKRWLISKQLEELTDKISIQGIILGGDDCIILNHVISVGIHMIYSQKQLSVALLLAILRSDFDSERYSAKLNDRMEEFNTKWDLLGNHLRGTG